MDAKKKLTNATVLSALVLFMVVFCFSARPAVGAIYYVSTDGNDSNAGTSPKLAWGTITHAAKKAQAGDLVRIKGGDYGAEHVVVANSGTAEAPIRFEGYDGQVRLEGKVKEVKGKMKLKGGGVLISGKAHVKVSGITAIKYGMAIMVNKGSHHVIVENCTAGFGGNAAISVIRSHHCQVRRCTAYNVCMSNIQTYESHDVIIADCWSYCDPRLIGIFPGLDTATDYCYAPKRSRNVLVTRCRGDFKTIHSGHGICFTSGSLSDHIPSRNCRVTDCEMYNGWEHFGVRSGGHDITFVNCYCEGSRRKNSSQGFYYRTGAHNITVKNCRAKGLACGLHAENVPRYVAKVGNTRNITFENCIATDCTTGIRINALNTKVLNCLSARNEYGMDICNLKTLEGLSVKGCIITGNEVGIRSPFATAKAITNCNVWGNKTKLAGKASLGAGCISKDPQFVIVRGMDNWHFRETSPCRDMGPYAADPKASIGMR